MLKIDFMNKSYSVAEIIDAYTDGDINNFKGDEDFLNFIISYAVGKYLEGPDDEDFMEYAEYDGITNMMLLDEYGYLGEKLYKLYEICGKDKKKFIILCGIIGKYSIGGVLDKSLIDINLMLTHPVDFMDDSIVLSSGTKPQFNPKAWLPLYELKYEERKEYEYEFVRSLKRRINESIQKNGDDVELFPELISYVDKKKIEEEQKLAKRVSDNHLININNLFYGSYFYSSGGGVLNLGLKTVSWFENTNTDMFGFHIFRSVPVGDYTLLDDNGMVHLPEKILKSDGIEVGPNTPIRKVNIANVPTILDAAIQKLEEEPITNENNIATLKHFFENLENSGDILVADLPKLERVIHTAYEIAYGEIFKKHNGEELDENPGSVSRG